MQDLWTVLIFAGAGFFVLLIIGLTITRLYRRASKETAFVRTGVGGERVVMNGGAMVLPVFHETMPVNMNTLVLSVVRRDGDRLKAVPYSVEYKQWLEPAAQLLDKAAAITTNPSLKKFLSLRAKAFRTDDYFESELAWMDLKDTPIEVAIGPYEVYTDRLYGAKAAFESFVTLKDPEESAALAKYKRYLKDMEANLPEPEEYKNFRRGFESPIAVAEQVHGGGDNVPGVQTIAFNLPNDERVREAKGAKKVILSNVLGAKYERILRPMAPLVLVGDQAGLVAKKYMQLETLFHELSHSLGPGTITIDGRETTVDAELKDQASALEEAKADVAGVWNILFMMDKGELPAAEKPQLFASYLTGIFRSMRFGTQEAHGKGAALQYGYLLNKGAFRWDAAANRYVIDDAKMESGLRRCTRCSGASTPPPRCAPSTRTRTRRRWPASGRRATTTAPTRSAGWGGRPASTGRPRRPMSGSRARSMTTRPACCAARWRPP